MSRALPAELPAVLLFDLDDTILRFGSGNDRLWEELAASHAEGLGRAPEAIVGAIRAAADAYWSHPHTGDRGRLDMLGARRQIVAQACRALGIERPDAARALADAYTWEREERVAPFPGAIETLALLRARGHRLALLTNGSGEFQRRKIARHGLADYFACILVEGELGFGKPDARVFASALAQLSVGAGEAWMVGDNLHADIMGAQSVGIRAIWVDAAGAGLPASPKAQPDHIVRSVAELMRTG